MDNNKNTWIEIFCDGACKGNPGPGGYGAILKYRDIVREISGCDPDTTNNRMEMTAVIEALRQVKRPSRIRVTTDSNYVVKGMTQWVHGWEKKNWINAQKKPVMNRDLWETLLGLGKKHQIDWKWIRGHAGHAENERCDAIAKEAIKKCTQKSANCPKMKDSWLDTIQHMTYGIYILTARYGEQINGMVASWVSQISYDPPLVMVAVHPKRYTHTLIEKGDAFALHILGKDQKDQLKRFKGPDPMAKFNSLEWSEGKTGSPILKRCLAFMECKVVAKYRPGNHTLFIGHILDGQAFSKGDALNTSDYEGVYIGKE